MSTTAGEFSGRSIGVLLASIVGMALGPTGLVLTTYTLFIEPMSADLQWDRADASLPVALIGMFLAFSSPLKGWLVDRWGARALVLPATIALALAIAPLALFQAADWRLLALFAAIGLFAPGNIPYGLIIGQWFHRRRGLAYGLLGFGFTLATPLGLQLARYLIDEIGWRGTFAVYAGLQVVVAWPLLYMYFRPPASAGVVTVTSADSNPPPGMSATEAWTSAPFWLIVSNLILTAFVIAGVATHGVPLVTSAGLTREAATTIVSALWIGTTLSQPLLGVLMDRWGTPRVALPFAVAALAGMLGLQWVGQSESAWFVALLLIGLGCGGESGTTQYFVTRYFGLRHFSVIYGSIQPFTMLLAIGAGSWLLGKLYDVTGSYRIDVLLMTAALAIAAVTFLWFPAYRFGTGAVRTELQAKVGDVAADRASA